ncbi:MAG: hypothetical protein ACHQ1H_15030, partial [Nitrososphaerales archaeon]
TQKKGGAEDPSEKSSYPLLELVQRLADYCRARVFLENSKIHHISGNEKLAAGEIERAARIFRRLAANSAKNDHERSRELETMASLSEALGSFQLAQSRTSLEEYMKAKALFDMASEKCDSKTLKPLLTGFSNLSAFLYFSNKLEQSLEVSFDPELYLACENTLSRALSVFKKIGNLPLMNTAKAGKNLLDAIIKVNAAEREAEKVEIRARLFSDAKKSLRIASRYYSLVGSKKNQEVIAKMIEQVAEQSGKIPRITDLLADLASNQMIYSAMAGSSIIDQTSADPSSDITEGYLTLEVSVGKNYLTVGEATAMAIVISNMGRERIVAIRLEDLVPECFTVTKTVYSISEGSTLVLNSNIDGLSSKKFSIDVEAAAETEFVGSAMLVYSDLTHKFRFVRAQALRISVEKVGRSRGVLLSERSALDHKIEAMEAGLSSARAIENNNEVVSKMENDLISARERVSSINEQILRMQNEHKILISEHETVKADLEAISHLESESGDLETQRKDLEEQEKI